MKNQPSLLDLLPTVEPSKLCHDCGNELTDKEALLPATCRQSMTCTSCCTSCHHKALGGMLDHSRRIRRWAA